MTGLVRHELCRTGGQPLFCITLTAPRANALEPGLLEKLASALDAMEGSGAGLALLTGGRNFSTGGDVTRFHDAAVSGNAVRYADRVVPLLQSLILRMISLPVLFAVAARGATTGGSAGFLFASDLAVLSPDAFVQPYYTTVGFAPDGGWTALLPERIAAGAAKTWLLRDARWDASALCRAGLAAEIDPEPEARAKTLLGQVGLEAALAAKSLIWNAERRARVRMALDAETAAFRSLISRAETVDKMGRFLGLEPAGSDV